MSMAVEVESRIERVLVGRSHAQVVRRARIRKSESGAFPTRVSLGGLALALDDQTIKVSVEGDATVRSATVAIAASDRGRADMPDEAEVRAARDEVEELRRTIEVKAEALSRLASVAVDPRPAGTKTDGPPRAPIDSRLALAKLVRSRQERLGDDVAKDRRVLLRAEEKLRDAEERRRRASSDRQPRPDELKKAVIVQLDPSASVEEVSLLLSYSIPGARWMPEYTLRIEKDTSRLEVRALVQQDTGEDWKNVDLSLSTATEQRWSDLPELASLRIGRAQRAPAKRGFRAPPEGAAALFHDYDAARSILDQKRAQALPPPTTRGIVVDRPASTRSMPARAADVDDGPDANVTRAGVVAGAAGPASDMLFRHAMPAPLGAPSGTTVLQQQSAGAKGRTDLKARLGKGGGVEKSIDEQMRDELMLMPASLPRKSGGLLAAIGGAFASNDAGGFAAPQSKSERAKHGYLSNGIDVDVGADQRVRSLGRLRLADPSASDRGELRFLSDAELYVEASVSVSSEIRVHLATTVARAVESASALTSRPAPARHVVPDPQDGFDFAFVAEAPVDIPSDGQGHAIAVTSCEAPIRHVHVVVPRESRDAYRVAEITSPLDAPLLAGPLDVYEGREFLLSTELETTPPRGKLEIGLGVDSAVKVARNIDFSEIVTGLMRGSLELRHKVTCEIANHRKDALRIDVRERVPTTLRDKDVRVEVISVEPRWDDYEQDEPKLKGGFVWHLEVPPGDKRKAVFEYAIHIAGKHELAGGNRRES